MLFNFLASNRMIQSPDPVLCGEYVDLTDDQNSVIWCL